MKRTKGKLKKGDLHYISKKKKQQWINTIFFVFLGITIFLIGYVLNDFSNRNIFTILAMLMVLPGARALTHAILFFPYKDAKEEDYKKLSKSLSSHLDAKFYASIILTSAQKVINLDFLFIGNGYVFGCLGKQTQDLNYIQNYLKTGVQNLNKNYQVKIVAKQEQFFKIVKNISAKNISKEEQQEVQEYMESLMV